MKQTTGTTDFLERLKDCDVILVREIHGREVKGVPVIKFEVSQKGFKTPHEFTFATANHMSKEDMANVMASYLRKNL